MFHKGKAYWQEDKATILSLGEQWELWSSAAVGAEAEGQRETLSMEPHQTLSALSGEGSWLTGCGPPGEADPGHT